MGKIKLRKWDTVEYLKTEEDMVMYLQACMEEAGDDAAFIAAALGDIARAEGMTQLAKDTGRCKALAVKRLFACAAGNRFAIFIGEQRAEQGRTRQNFWSRRRRQTHAEPPQPHAIGVPQTKTPDREGSGESEWWSGGGSNSRPSHCERDALPAELPPRKNGILA